MSKEQELPYQALGQRLKAVRKKLQESVPEVSGAVEIDASMLERIEQGRERPSEDILDLLIAHFDIRDDEAAGLWQLAGYEPPCDCEHDHTARHTTEEAGPQQAKGTVMIMFDPRIVYSDHIQAAANQSGVVLHFAQKANMHQGIAAARIGMSREQARTVARTIEEALQRSEPRQLPQPQQKREPRPTDKKPPKKHEQ